AVLLECQHLVVLMLLLTSPGAFGVDVAATLDPLGDDVIAAPPGGGGIGCHGGGPPNLITLLQHKEVVLWELMLVQHLVLWEMMLLQHHQEMVAVLLI
nr:hypothetical protein [Tanacetum cinerariifolium]